jgi:hypothetical protein
VGLRGIFAIVANSNPGESLKKVRQQHTVG